MSQTVVETSAITRLMPMYRILIHNDPITTFEFVVKVLVQVFNKEVEFASKLALEVHLNEIGLVGVYPLEHAEFLVDQAKAMALTEKFPLTFTIEPA